MRRFEDHCSKELVYSTEGAGDKVHADLTRADWPEGDGKLMFMLTVSSPFRSHIKLSSSFLRFQNAMQVNLRVQAGPTQARNLPSISTTHF